MGKFGRSWALVKSSWSVVRADKELLALPVISGVASLLTMASFLIPIVLTARVDQADGTTGFEIGPFGYVLVFVMYVVLAYITIFFNTGLVCAADERMRGGDPTIGSALRGAASRAVAILPWAIISATVSMILRSLEERAGFLGRIVIGLIGMAWSLITFLVLPILVLEGVGVGTAIKRSGELFKRTWGENVIANAAIGLIGFAVALFGAALVGAAAITGYAPAIATAVVVAVLLVLAASVVLSALGVVFQVALYRYATDGVAPPQFATVDLGHAFSPKT